jgi:hypothetical protein
MSSSAFSIVHLAITVLVVLTQLIVVGAALGRFRITPAGIVVALSYLGFAGLSILGVVVYRFVLPAAGAGETGYAVTQVGLGLTDFALTLLLAVGVGLIPRSLARLERGS